MSSKADRVVTGNYFNKHATTNPLYRALTRRYRLTLQRLAAELSPANALEIGSGEGYIVSYLREVHPALRITASDIDPALLRRSAAAVPQAGWLACYGEALPFAARQFDLVVACEVLEHVSEPGAVMAELRRTGRRWFLGSVPHEPWWRLLNMARLKYLPALGNTPGHIQHWGRGQFARFAGQFVRIHRVESAFPWTFVCGEWRE